MIFFLFLGISYITHPQAKPTRVTDFQNIERITTTILDTVNTASASSSAATDNNHSSNLKVTSNSNNSNVTNSPISHKKLDKRGGSSSASGNNSSTSSTTTCHCNDIKTQIKIKVTGNAEDLAITCNGVKTAESIADLVDGYCRIVNNSELSLWDRTCKCIQYIYI